MNEWLWRGIAAGVGAYGVALGGVFAGQRHLMYFPDSQCPAPGESGVPEMAEVTLETDDGLALLAWHRPPARDALPTLVYFHGNAGHIGMRADKVRPFLDAGFGVLLTTWRGYSGNPGKPSEDGLYRDGRAARDYLLEVGVAASNIVMYGESLGTGVAVQLASEQAPAALVLEAPYNSIADVAQARIPLLPVKPLVLDRFDSQAKIASVAAPLLIVHGARDGTIPVRFGKKLFAAASEPKQMQIYPEAGHNDLHEHGMGRLTLDFLKQSIPTT
ncbi:MAG: alpha/beta hydrolase [Rhodospirillaceae bacterium]|nr:alpha/beta hydrolase [Rhodospirillaceae bacterium]MBT7291555.1 alpha/beta hydrolase [Rhodospirillaceae bacterium]